MIFGFKVVTVTSAKVLARDSLPPTTSHIHNQAHVSHVCGHKMATLKHVVLACKIEISKTCGVQGMWMCVKQNMLQIWKLIQNSDLHMVFKPKNDPKYSREANRRGENAHTLLGGHKHVIQSD